MNVHIILEDDCVDLRLRAVSLLEILGQYPCFKETSLEDAEYLIIIPNYPMAGKQDFRTSLHNLIYEQTDNISEGKILLLDCDNTFFILDESSSHYKEKITYFLDKNVEITEVFGLSPKDIKQATDFIKTGKRPNVVLEDKITEPLQEIKPKKRRMLLGL